ncbi:MAG: 1-(5-phosphoribosyl)-5-[(5-phosphoribosylamino)methylideneamino]imidazole-4-carboxamide isomerase [Acidimicrobiales bacterium]
MDLWPAIDIRGGICVRLRQGRFSEQTEYGDPLEIAHSYLQAGADRLHVVDLDAARTGSPANRDAIVEIARATGLVVQAGGGVRDVESASALLDRGVARVVVGTTALVQGQQALASMLERWPGRVVVGLDYRTERLDGDRVSHPLAVRGWTETIATTVEEALGTLSDWPIAALVVTDIGRDGTGAGPDVDGYAELLALTAHPLIASGGVASVEDIARLARLTTGRRSLAGVIVGKALLGSRLTVADARRATLGLER